MTPRPRRIALLRWIPNAWVTTSGPRVPKSLYLTFDDGPHPEHTQPLLELLDRHNAKATFFLVGDQVEKYPHLAQQIAAGGHVLGNHSHSHPLFDQIPLAAQLQEIDRTDRLLQEIDGRARHGFRSPRGVLPPALMWHFLKNRRHVAYWSYDSMDYSGRPAHELIEEIERHPVRSGEIVLMHDDSAISLQLLKTMIPLWEADGFALRALPVR